MPHVSGLSHPSLRKEVLYPVAASTRVIHIPVRAVLTAEVVVQVLSEVPALRAVWAAAALAAVPVAVEEASAEAALSAVEAAEPAEAADSVADADNSERGASFN